MSNFIAGYVKNVNMCLNTKLKMVSGGYIFLASKLTGEKNYYTVLFKRFVSNHLVLSELTYRNMTTTGVSWYSGVSCKIG